MEGKDKGKKPKGSMMKEVLRVMGLCKVFGNGENLVNALSDVSFLINRGEFVAITGVSGSGKSSLLHILGGVDRPSNGKVFIENKDIFSTGKEELAIFRRRQVGLIYQFYNLVPVLNVVENIVLPLKLDGKKVDPEHLDRLLELLGLQDRRKHLPKQLSGGQQQRVSIGRALIHSPAIVLADEPTGNLDQENSQQIIQLLKQSNKQYNQTVVIVTHDENIVRQAERVICLRDGKMISDTKSN